LSVGDVAPTSGCLNLTCFVGRGYIPDGLFADENQMEIHEAVAYSLLARHYKRVAGPLSNISTAVVGQLSVGDVAPTYDCLSVTCFVGRGYIPDGLFADLFRRSGLHPRRTSIPKSTRVR
jgi:hypothetical protein